MGDLKVHSCSFCVVCGPIQFMHCLSIWIGLKWILPWVSESYSILRSSEQYDTSFTFKLHVHHFFQWMCIQTPKFGKNIRGLISAADPIEQPSLQQMPVCMLHLILFSYPHCFVLHQRINKFKKWDLAGWERKVCSSRKHWCSHLQRQKRALVLPGHQTWACHWVTHKSACDC